MQIALASAPPLGFCPCPAPAIPCLTHLLLQLMGQVLQPPRLQRQTAGPPPPPAGTGPEPGGQAGWPYAGGQQGRPGGRRREGGGGRG